MPLIDSDSDKCNASELDLFSILPTDVSFPDSQIWHIENPVTSISSGGVIDFAINSNPEVYLDLRSSFIVIEFSINDSSGAEIIKTSPEPRTDELNDAAQLAAAKTINKAKIAFPEQYIIGSIFKNVEVWINDTLVSSADNLYPYRAYIETLLSYNKHVKNEQLRMSGYFNDTGGNAGMEWRDADVLVDEISGNDNRIINKGVNERFMLTKYGKKMQVIGRIHADMFNQTKYIPGKNQIKVKFTRNTPEFFLRSADDNSKFTFKIEKMVLAIKKSEVSPHIRMAHEKKLQLDKTFTAKYAFPHIQMKFFMQPSAQRHINEPNLCNGLIPNKIVIGLVSSDALNGSYVKNPFNFKNMGATSVILRKNGNPAPFQELSLDFPNDRYLMGYLSLMIGTGRLFENDGLGITPEEYKNGKCLYVFDLTNTSTKECMSLQQTGRVSLDIRLDENVPEGITVVAFLQYDSVLHINSDAEVTLSNRNGVSEI